MSEQQVVAPPSPYKGLAAFEDSSVDALFFFGREREREIVAANLLAYRLTVLYGASGVGKSSLLRAGVAYHLRRGGEAVVVFSSWSGDPVTSLLEEVRETLRTPAQEDPSDGLAARIADWTGSLGRELYLILDQFDEYFLYHLDDDNFAAQLAEVVTRPGLRVNVVLSIRDDMLSRLDRFKALIPNLLSNYLRLDHLDRTAARDAIVGPLARYNALVPADDQMTAEPALVEAVLDQTIAGRVDSGEPLEGNRVEAPYLQLVMQRLWEEERSGGSPTLRLETLERLGGAEEIVRAHLGEALESLSLRDRDLAAKLFNHLVTPSGTKIAHGIGDLAQYASVSERDVAPVLSALVEERIVRPVTASGQPDGSRYEIFHDVLADPVVAWRSKHEAERELARTRAQAHRRNRRLLAVTILSLIAVASMVLVTIFALAQRHEARKQRAQAEAAARSATADELTARAALDVSTDPQRSLGLALRAARLEPTAEIERVLRDAIRGSPLAVLRVGTGRVNDVQFSRGAFAIAGGESGTAIVFRWRNGQIVRKLEHGPPIKVALLSPRGGLAVTAGGRGAATDLWNFRSERRLRLPQHGTVTDASLTRDASKLATAGTDGSVDVWDTRSGELLVRIPVRSAVKSVEFNHDGDLLLVVRVDGQVSLFDAATGDVLNTFGPARFYKPQTQLFEFVTQGAVDAATFSPGGDLAVTAGHDGSVFVWEVPSDRLHKWFQGTGQPLDVEFSPRGSLFVAASADGTGMVWNAGKGRVSPLAGHTSQVKHGSFSPDGTLVVTASTDGTARVWDAKSGRPLLVLAGHQGPLTDAEFSPNGKRAATTGADGTVRLWDARPEPPLTPVGELHARVTAIAIGPSGRRLVAGTAKRGASLWEIGRDAPLSTIHAPGSILAAAFGSEPLVLVSRARGSTMWNVAKHRKVAAVRHAHKPTAAAMTPDGRVFATARARFVTLWGRKGRLFVLESPSIVTGVALSRDGRRIAAAGVNGSVVTWKVRTGKQLSTCNAGTKKLTSVAFDSPGDSVVASSNDSSVRICDARTGATQRDELRWHHSEVSGAAFSADGRWVATAGPRTAGVGLSSGQLLFRLPGHKKGTLLTVVAWSPKGHRIVTGDTAGGIRTYECRLCSGVRELLPIAQRRLRKIGKR
jgi:WD40 repeat protein